MDEYRRALCPGGDMVLRGTGGQDAGSPPHHGIVVVESTVGEDFGLGLCRIKVFAHRAGRVWCELTDEVDGVALVTRNGTVQDVRPFAVVVAVIGVGPARRESRELGLQHLQSADPDILGTAGNQAGSDSVARSRKGRVGLGGKRAGDNFADPGEDSLAAAGRRRRNGLLASERA